MTNIKHKIRFRSDVALPCRVKRGYAARRLKMAKDVEFKSSANIKTKTSEPKLEIDIVATVKPSKGELQTLVYESTTPSGALISDSTSQIGIELEPYYLEEITESVERSRGLLDGGFKFGFKLPDALGGAEFNFERKPREETKKLKKAMFRTPKK